jgi:hypothetical protein
MNYWVHTAASYNCDLNPAFCQIRSKDKALCCLWRRAWSIEHGAKASNHWNPQHPKKTKPHVPNKRSAESIEHGAKAIKAQPSIFLSILRSGDTSESAESREHRESSPQPPEKTKPHNPCTGKWGLQSILYKAFVSPPPRSPSDIRMKKRYTNQGQKL